MYVSFILLLTSSQLANTLSQANILLPPWPEDEPMTFGAGVGMQDSIAAWNAPDDENNNEFTIFMLGADGEQSNEQMDDKGLYPYDRSS
jgi:hypothetical protein